MNLTIRLILSAFVVALAGCASYDRRLTSSSTRYLSSGGEVVTKPSNVGIADTVSYWDGDGVSGSPSITINLGEQKAFFYKGDRLVGVSMISSGREGYATPAGTYKVIQKSKDHVSNLYGDYVDGGGNVMVANVGVKRRLWIARRLPAWLPGLARMRAYARAHGANFLCQFLAGYAGARGQLTSRRA
jgi:hypothetical protein